MVTGTGLFFALAWNGAAKAQAPSPATQEQLPAQPQPNPQAPPPEQAISNPVAPCVQPSPMVRWQDYQGPFAKTVGLFARKLERKSVRTGHYKPGAVLCTLVLEDKFMLFVEDTIDPVTFLGAAFNAGIGQAEDSDPSYEQGMEGYGKRFGANMADQASSEFFKDFAYPTIFFEDPRYYRLAFGTKRQRLTHGLLHVFVAHHEDGTPMFNYSEWFGTTSAVALSNTYHPDYKRGFGPASIRVSLGVANDAGFNVLREFWPDLARKFKLPFRDPSQPQN
jgi:hypothetical protein